MLVIACFSQHAVLACMHHHGWPKPQFVNISEIQIDGSCSSLSVAARLHGKLCDCVTFQGTPPRSRSQSRTGWAMAFPRINCNTTMVTVLTATAATTLSLRVCASRLNPYHKTTTAGTFHDVHFPKQLDHLSGQSSQSHPVKTASTKRVPSQDMACHTGNVHHQCAESVGRE